MNVVCSKEVMEQLVDLAQAISHGFCYGCYVKAVETDGKEVCPKCGSDDLMREVGGVGCEYGLDWVVEHLVQVDGELVDVTEEYRDVIDDCNPEVEVCGYKWAASYVLENLDEVSFRLGMEEWADAIVEDGGFIECDGHYYRYANVTA